LHMLALLTFAGWRSECKRQLTLPSLEREERYDKRIPIA